MQNLYHAIQAFILLITPFTIAASLLVILGLVLDLPGHVRNVRDSFRRARKTVSEVEHDWETVYRD